MTKPLLQVALDTLDIPSTLKTAKALTEEVDVLEAGTILMLCGGRPNHIDVAGLVPRPDYTGRYKPSAYYVQS